MAKTQINFLDVIAYLENRKIKTDLSVKPTDTHQYLHTHQYHPYYCKKGIPYSQTLCLILIDLAQIQYLLIGDVMT